MRQTVIYLTLVLLALTFIIVVSADNHLRIGPIYADKLPQLQIVIERPGRLAESVAAPNPQDLTLIEDGIATVTASTVSRFGDTARGMAIVLAVDVSRSMQGEPLNDIKSALMAYIDKMSGQDRVALVSFADEWKVESPFDDSRDHLRAAINNLTASGTYTRLNTGLYKSLALFDGQGLPARKRVLVISDGHDERSSFTEDDVISEARNRRVPIDAIGFTQSDRKYLGDMERFASLSGGNYVEAENSDGLVNIFQRGIERLQATPVATFSAQNLRGDDQKHRLGVRLNSASQIVGEDETSLVLLRSPVEPTKPVEVSSLPPKASPRRWPWFAAGGGFLLLVLLLVWWSRRSGQVAAAPPPFEPALPAPPPVVTSPDPYAAKPMYPEVASIPVAAATEGDLATPVAIGQPEPAAARPQRRRTKIRTEFTAPSAGHPTAVLVFEDGPLRGTLSPIESATFWIGAEPGNSLCVEDERLSGFHACIQFHEGSLFLHDNGSTNGSFVNNERVEQVPKPLTVGDRIRVGATVLVLMSSEIK